MKNRFREMRAPNGSIAEGFDAFVMDFECEHKLYINIYKIHNKVMQGILIKRLKYVSSCLTLISDSGMCRELIEKLEKLKD